MCAGTPSGADQSCCEPQRADGRLGFRDGDDQGGAVACSSSKVKRALLIVNPYSTHVTGPAITAVESALRERVELSRRASPQYPGHATELAAAAAADAVDAIVVFSGDGTYNEALNGADGAVPFGFLPGGGTSVLPRALGLPRDPVAAARAVGAALAEGPAAADLARRGERPPLLLLGRHRLRRRGRAPARRARPRPRAARGPATSRSCGCSRG